MYLIPKSAVHVGTREYERSHMKLPRGRGSWAFRLSPMDEDKYLFWVSGTYAEAKAKAIDAARARGCRDIEVQP